jgi:hypothetical protein
VAPPVYIPPPKPVYVAPKPVYVPPSTPTAVVINKYIKQVNNLICVDVNGTLELTWDDSATNPNYKATSYMILVDNT